MAIAHLYGWDETTGELVKCIVTAEGKLIINASGFLENPPTEDQALKAPTSEWAYDHWKNVSAHHAATVAGDLDHQDLANRSTDDHHTKYTDADARASINNLIGADGRIDNHLWMDYKDILNISGFMMKLSYGDEVGWGFNKINNQGLMRMTAYEYGVGYTNAVLQLYDGSAYQEIIREDTFQAELDDYLENPPIEDSVNTAPTSEWAYDHWKDAAAHHAVYSDANSVGAWYSRFLQINNGTHTNTDVTGISYILFSNSGGDVILKGLAGGVTGQMIFCVKNYDINDIHVIHESGDAAAGDKIRTVTAADESIASGNFGCFWLVWHGGNWIVDHTLI